MKKIIKFCFRCIWNLVKFVFNPPPKVSRLARKALAAGLASSIEFDKQQEKEVAANSKKRLEDWIRIHGKI